MWIPGAEKRGAVMVFSVPKLGRFLGRGCDEALFSEKKGFSVKRAEAIQ